MNLLLVDDDPEIRLVAGLVLRGAGHVVAEAASAEEAAERLADGTFDVVLLDVMLGEDDGVELAISLLSGEYPPTLVFLTGATRADQQARMAAAGPAGILHKPFDPGALAGDLQRILDAAAS